MRQASLFWLLLFSCFSVSCITSMGSVDLRTYGAYVHADAGNNKFKDIKMVYGRKTSWSWSNCNQLADDALADMVTKAKDAGADTVYDVRFKGKRDFDSKEPLCNRRFFPLVFLWATASVRGMAAQGIKELKSGNADKISPELMEKAKKCGEKGGVFLNDTCQISVE